MSTTWRSGVQRHGRIASCSPCGAGLGPSCATLVQRIAQRVRKQACLAEERNVAQAPRRNLRASAMAGNRANEAPQERMERQLRESAEVEERVVSIDSEEEFLTALDEAGHKLVVVEVQSERVCETGIDEPEPELHWKLDAEQEQARRMAKCAAVKHTIMRTARECPDVSFLYLETDGSSERDALVQKLGVTVLPTLQFYREGKLLWEHRGVMQMEAGVGEGVMYYGDAATATSGGEHPSSLVTEITSRAGLQQFLAAESDPKVLQVLNVALTSAGPCIKVFPAVVALSRTFKGFATFGRLMGDVNGDTRSLLQELNIIEVPTFIFFRAGKEVGRHVGSSRGDLIGQILQQQEQEGLSPPPPPVTAKVKPRSRAGMRRGRTAQQ